MKSEDAINRKAALDAIYEHWLNGTVALRIIEEIQDSINALPPVQPKAKTGHWIATRDYLTTAYGSIDYVKCSCCGEDSLEEGDFCPNCGAKMEGEENDV